MGRTNAFNQNHHANQLMRRFASAPATANYYYAPFDIHTFPAALFHHLFAIGNGLGRGHFYEVSFARIHMEIEIRGEAQ